jgi:hypothetical protein
MIGGLASHWRFIAPQTASGSNDDTGTGAESFLHADRSGADAPA